MPAEHAGVRVGDLIVSVGDEPVNDVSELRQALGDRAGETFKIRVIRDKKAIDLDVTLPATEDEAITGPQAFLRGVPPAPPAMAVPPAPPAVTAPPAPRAVPAPPKAPGPVLVPPPAPRRRAVTVRPHPATADAPALRSRAV